HVRRQRPSERAPDEIFLRELAIDDGDAAGGRRILLRELAPFEQALSERFEVPRADEAKARLDLDRAPIAPLEWKGRECIARAERHHRGVRRHARVARRGETIG